MYPPQSATLPDCSPSFVFQGDFNLPFDHPLIPPPDAWPSPDHVSFHIPTSSLSSPVSAQYLSSPEYATSVDLDTPPSFPVTVPTSEHLTSQPRPTRGKSPNHIPRPRNAFMIFRSEFWAQQKISGTIERDHRHISRIIAHCWHGLSDEQKKVWKDKAETEKLLHSRRYPGYRFSPVGRRQKPVKRNVRRNGAVELNRCKQVAALLLAGKEGDELETAVKQIDVTVAEEVSNPTEFLSEQSSESMVNSWQSSSGSMSQIDVPVFRSPLFPPAQLVTTHHDLYTQSYSQNQISHNDFDSHMSMSIDASQSALQTMGYANATPTTEIDPALLAFYLQVPPQNYQDYNTSVFPNAADTVSAGSCPSPLIFSPSLPTDTYSHPQYDMNDYTNSVSFDSFDWNAL